MEIKSELKGIRIDYLCPKCNKENMVQSGMACFTHPPKWEHECVGCGYKMFLDKVYPRFDIENKHEGDLEE